MEGRDDARICRDRCLEALVTAEDRETAAALWRAALRYNERMRAAETGGEYSGPRLTSAGVHLSGGRSC